MRNKIKITITSLLITSALNNSNADGLAFEKPSNVDQYYFSIDTSHAFKVSSQGKKAFKKNGYKSDLPNIDLALGMYVTDNYRLELSAGYRKFTYKHSYVGAHREHHMKHSATIYRLMLNNYYDFTTINNMFTPYAMVGIGFAHSKAAKFVQNIVDHEFPACSHSTSTKSKSSTNLSYQFGLGVDVKLSEKTSLDFGVRHVNYGKLKSGYSSLKLKSNEFLVGLKYNF